MTRFSTSFPAPEMIGTYVIKSQCPLEFQAACNCCWLTMHRFCHSEPNRTPVSSMANCWWAGSFSPFSPTIDTYAAKYPAINSGVADADQIQSWGWAHCWPRQSWCLVRKWSTHHGLSFSPKWVVWSTDVAYWIKLPWSRGRLQEESFMHHWTRTSSWALGIFCFLALNSSILWWPGLSRHWRVCSGMPCCWANFGILGFDKPAASWSWYSLIAASHLSETFWHSICFFAAWLLGIRGM